MGCARGMETGRGRGWDMCGRGDGIGTRTGCARGWRRDGGYYSESAEPESVESGSVEPVGPTETESVDPTEPGSEALSTYLIDYQQHKTPANPRSTTLEEWANANPTTHNALITSHLRHPTPASGFTSTAPFPYHPIKDFFAFPKSFIIFATHFGTAPRAPRSGNTDRFGSSVG